MSRRNIRTTENQQESDARSSNSKKNNELISSKSRRKLLITRPQNSNRHSSYQSSSIMTSFAKITDDLESQRISKKNEETYSSRLPQFTQKYLPKGSTPQQIYEQMLSISIFKERQIQTLRVYRDELKFISYSSPYSAPIKVSIKLLQDKAEIESKIKAQKQQILNEIKQMQNESKNLKEYTQMVFEHAQQFQQNDKFLDMGKQKQIMVENIRKQIIHIIQELDSQKRKNLKQVRNIQDQIYDLRIKIKQKQDKIRELKAKICTHYIKMHSRNSSGSRSKDKNMSMSVRKFNTSKNEAVREVFIGNHQFKNFSKQIIEKVEGNELVKLQFYIQKDKKLIFRCIYEKKEGILHTHQFDYTNKLTTQKKEKDIESQPIYVKYLMSIKFYFKSSLVGVECRVKTQKGNKHIQIGNCQSHIEHELVTLVNRRLMTLGSYWHGKQMIGISVWFMEESSKKIEVSKKVQERRNNGNSFEEYFT